VRTGVFQVAGAADESVNAEPGRYLRKSGPLGQVFEAFSAGSGW